MRVVISLTTIPGRRRLLDRTLASLSRQTRPPDSVYLWLPSQNFSADDPRNRFPGVEVRTTKELGPATKILPVLSVENDPDTRIITVDDDIEYPPELVDRLINTSVMLPDHAIGFTGWCLDDDQTAPQVHHRNEDVIEAGMHQHVHVLEGYRGVVYRRGFFQPDIFEHLEALRAFRYHDDILLSGYLASRGLSRTVRWFGASSQPPGGVYWKLLGQDTGLHTGADWLQHGQACMSYWKQRAADVWGPTPIRARLERLQLNVEGGARDGFIHHGMPGCATCVDVVYDLTHRPWCWPDSTFNEILTVNEPPRPIEQFASWLSECHRILRPGGVMKIRCLPRPDEATVVAICTKAPHEWMCAWEPDGNYRIGTFVKLPADGKRQ